MEVIQEQIGLTPAYLQWILPATKATEILFAAVRMLPELVLNGKRDSFETIFANITRDPHNLPCRSSTPTRSADPVADLVLRLGGCQALGASPLHIYLTIGMEPKVCLKITFRVQTGFTHHTFVAGVFLEVLTTNNLLVLCQHVLWG